MAIPILSDISGKNATFAGAVGIGAAAASGMLDVKGADTDNAVIARFYSATGSRGRFIIRNGSGTNPTTFIGTGGGSEQLSIGTNDTEAIRIDAAHTKMRVHESSKGMRFRNMLNTYRNKIIAGKPKGSQSSIKY